MICNFKTVIFDLDGVITKTAIVHFKAWKQAFDEYLRLRESRDKESFQEFTHQKDYLPFVDGKPRYQGVKSFLESRGINLPFGDPQDSPDQETVCGIGNRKNIKFKEVLMSQGVEVYPSTIKLIKGLKDSGVRVGVASSSKNCQYILEAANIEGLFETRVDGLVSMELGLKGKPDADIFVKAAYNLNSLPCETVVVEDATSGVLAGRNGGFGLVLGVAREHNMQDLFDNGADVVVDDLGKIDLDFINEWFAIKPISIHSQNLSVNKDSRINSRYGQSFSKLMSTNKLPAFFLDYDGTLTPIVSRPDQAVLSESMKKVLNQLINKYTVAIVSGRSRTDVEKLIGIEGLFYAGNHGFDIKGPGLSMVLPEAESIIPIINEITAKFKDKFSQVKGAIVEEKKFSVALHYRLVEKEEKINMMKEEVEKVVSSQKLLRLMHGKKVFEVLPAVDWNKGKAILRVMQSLGVSWDKNTVIYLGDDTTDEDAFRVIRSRGIGILVSSENKISWADFCIESPLEVERFFNSLL